MKEKHWKKTATKVNENYSIDLLCLVRRHEVFQNRNSSCSILPQIARCHSIIHRAIDDFRRFDECLIEFLCDRFLAINNQPGISFSSRIIRVYRNEAKRRENRTISIDRKRQNRPNWIAKQTNQNLLSKHASHIKIFSNFSSMTWCLIFWRVKMPSVFVRENARFGVSYRRSQWLLSH